MCGLAGWQLLPNSKAPASLAASSAVLCQCASERGEDAWGVIGSHADGTPGYRIVKGLGSITKAKFARRLGRLNTVALHTRYGTTGKNTVRNAHPFTIPKTGGGTIIGMHNGVVYNHWDLQRDNKRNAEVDSEHIFMHIAQGLPLSEVEAYGAVLYVDSAEPDAFLMGRFNSGELNVARIAKNGEALGIMWSSTYKALSNAAALGGFKATFIQIDYGKLYRVAEGEIWNTDLKLDIGKQHVSKASTYTTMPYATYTPGHSTTGKFKAGKWVTDDGVHKYSGNGYGTGTSWKPSNDKSVTACEICQNELEDCICEDVAGLVCDSCAEYGDNCLCSACYCAHCIRMYSSEDESDRYADDGHADDGHADAIAEAEATLAESSEDGDGDPDAVEDRYPGIGKLRDQETRRAQLSLPSPGGSSPGGSSVLHSPPCEACGFQHTPGYCQSALVTV